MSQGVEDLICLPKTAWPPTYLTNDLYAPAVKLSKDVEDGYLSAVGFSPIGAVMTGSGSCSLAMFENEEFCRWAQSRYKGKAKTYVVKTVIPEKKKGWKNPFKLSEDEMEAGE